MTSLTKEQRRALTLVNRRWGVDQSFTPREFAHEVWGRPDKRQGSAWLSKLRQRGLVLANGSRRGVHRRIVSHYRLSNYARDLLKEAFVS